jgi:hypothetical protein
LSLISPVKLIRFYITHTIRRVTDVIVVHLALVVHPPFVLYHLVWIEEKILLILLSSFAVIAIVVIYTVIVRNSKAHFHHSVITNSVEGIFLVGIMDDSTVLSLGVWYPLQTASEV